LSLCALVEAVLKSDEKASCLVEEAGPMENEDCCGALEVAEIVIKVIIGLSSRRSSSWSVIAKGEQVDIDRLAWDRFAGAGDSGVGLSRLCGLLHVVFFELGLICSTGVSTLFKSLSVNTTVTENTVVISVVVVIVAHLVAGSTVAADCGTTSDTLELLGVISSFLSLGSQRGVVVQQSHKRLGLGSDVDPLVSALRVDVVEGSKHRDER
ncbi:hypothetical protein WICPIJ_001913, partial [Wickerhamomyces pijperi]